MLQGTSSSGIRIFTMVWFGQLVSLIGSGLTRFALGVWVYQRTGSATLFTLITVCTILPDLALSPLAGALVDRWNRRWAMILSDSGSSLCTLVIALLFMAGQLKIWHICLAIATSSAFRAFQLPAYLASITMLVPKLYYGHISGLIQFGRAVPNVFSPVLGALLLMTIQIHGVILVDFATFLFALAMLLLVRIPSPEATNEGHTGEGSLLREATYGWTYIMARPGLRALLLFFATNNLLTGIGVVLVTPLVLSFASPTVLGTVLSISGGGFLVGSLVMSIWGGPKRYINGVFITSFVRGLCLLMAGLYPSAAFIAVAMGLFFFNLPIIAGCSQAIWQKKVAPDIQGRVFAIRKMISWSAYPLAYLIAGLLADYTFERLLVTDGLLASSVGRIIGDDPGRGIGLLYVVVGILSILQTAVCFLSPCLRFVDEEVPDSTTTALLCTSTSQRQDNTETDKGSACPKMTKY